MRLLYLLGLIWLSANPLADLEPAQKPDEGLGAALTFDDSTDAVLVEVPVEVLRGGESVRGLRAEDFLLFDNGLPQEIASVDENELADLERLGAGADLAVAARRHYLLLFDLSFNSSAGLARAQAAALDLLDRGLDPTDLVAVATVGLKGGVRLLLGFSPDHAQARLSVLHLGRQAQADWRPDPLQLYLGEPEARDAKLGAFAPANEPEQGISVFQHLLDRQANSRGRRDIQIYTESLATLARLMRAARGHKQVVLFSEGFDGRLLIEDADSLKRTDAQMALQQGNLALVDSDTIFGSRQVVDSLSRLTEELRRADCTVHSVDVAGIDGRGRDGLVMLARDTGGELVSTIGNPPDLFAQVRQHGRHTYLLTYRPSDLELDGTYRKIRVKLRDPDGRVRVLHRPGYFATGVPVDGPSARLAVADRVLDRRAGAIKAKLHALPTDEAIGDRRHVPVVVEVKGLSFLGGERLGAPGKGQGRLAEGQRAVVDAEVFVYALGQDGAIADYFSQGISFDLANHGPSLRKNGFKLFAPLLLPSGRFTLRALVRNADQNLFGLATSSLAVPAAKGRTSSLPPHLLDPEWLLVRAERRDLAPFREIRDSLDLLAEELAKTPVAQPAPAGTRAAPPAGPDLHSLPARYRDALELYATGTHEQGLAELERFEVTVGNDQERAGRLERIELDAIRRLSQQGGSDVLWPVLLAHHDLYFVHRSNKRAFLELHSREMVVALSNQIAKDGSDALRLAAGQALASIGCNLATEGRGAGFDLIGESLELDPGNEAAHLCMAAYFEKFGGPYESAVEWLEQLVARHPESREGRLRLAINSLRLADQGNAPARRQDALELFQGLLAEERPDWVGSVAAQELSRLLIKNREMEEALAVLETAAVSSPTDQELLIQLSFLYDRLGRNKAGREMVAHLGEGSATAGGARGRYNQWTSDALSTSRRELKAGAESRFDALSSALDSAAPAAPVRSEGR